MGAGLHRAGHQLPQRRLRVPWRGGADRPGAGLHRLDHRDHLTAADFADDLAATRLNRNGVIQRLIQTELTGLPTIGAALPDPDGLPGVHDRMLIRHLVRCSSYSVSKVPIASYGGISAHKARTIVVFPDP